MPDLIIHELLSKMLFNDPYTSAHGFFDAGKIICPSVIHRLFPPHDPLSAIIYSYFKNDLRVILVYIQHIIQDSLQLLFFPFSVIIERFVMNGLEKNKKDILYNGCK